MSPEVSGEVTVWRDFGWGGGLEREDWRPAFGTAKLGRLDKSLSRERFVIRVGYMPAACGG